MLEIDGENLNFDSKLGIFIQGDYGAHTYAINEVIAGPSVTRTKLFEILCNAILKICENSQCTPEVVSVWSLSTNHPDRDKCDRLLQDLHKELQLKFPGKNRNN